MGVCGSLSKTFTPFVIKVCDFPYPIYDFTKNSIPYLYLYSPYKGVPPPENVFPCLMELPSCFKEILHSFQAVSCQLGFSLRSKRFRGVREQRKTEKRHFRCFARAKNGARAKKRKVFWFSPHFSRGKKHRKSRSSVFLCFQTPRKRLLRRLVRV